MPAKLDYVVRETLGNLRRNFTLTAASIVTVFVSLALVGSAFVVREAVQHSTKRWRGDVQFIVFMNPPCSPKLDPKAACSTKDQIDAVGRSLQSNPQVDRATYFDQQQAYDEFKDLFRDSPDLVQSTDPATLPPSWRVSPETHDADAISAIGKQFENQPGVYRVVFAYETVKTFEKASGVVSWVILVTALCLLVAACMLILNTIRMAVFARRREIEVMKLVGATNWFIRIPFMLEGLVQGILGAVPAVVAVWVLRWAFDNVSNNQSLRIFQGLFVSSTEVTVISLILVALGCVVGAIGSFVAVTRFLDV